MNYKAFIYVCVILALIGQGYSQEFCSSHHHEDESEAEICPDLHECIDGRCIHKDIFPMSQKEIVGSILIMVVTGLANAGGSSGTALTTLLLLICFNYNENKSVMIAFALVFGGSLGNFLNVGNGKNLETGKPLINYDITLLCMPLMLLGTSVGIMVNRAIAPILIAAGLAGVMYLSLGKIYKQAKKQYQLESNNHKPQEERDSSGQAQALELDRSPTKILQKDLEEASHNDDEGLINDEWREVLEEEKETFPRKKFTLLGSLLLFNMVMALLKGTSKFGSLLGFEFCSNGYWTLFWIGVAGCLVFFFWNRRLVKKMTNIKNMMKLHLSNKSTKEFEITDEAIVKLAKSSLLAGFVAGLLGMGGSTVMGPILLGLGIDVQTVVATSGFFVVQTSMMALFQSILYGDIAFLEFMFFLVLSFLGSYGISYVLSLLVKFTKRPSLILFILVGIFSLALVTMPIFELWRSIHNFKELFTFHSFCK